MPGGSQGAETAPKESNFAMDKELGTVSKSKSMTLRMTMSMKIRK